MVMFITMKLRPYLDEQNITPADFARMIKVEPASVHRYLTGERIPRMEILGRIIQVTRGAVQANDFFASAQSRQVAMASDAVAPTPSMARASFRPT